MYSAKFFSYVFVSSFTPGPNNIMAMSNSAKVGFRKGLRFCFGVFIGFALVAAACTAFSSALYEYIPAAVPYMKIIGALYILFLAFTVLRDKPHKENGRQRLNPGSLFSGVIMQFVNIKGILYGITAASNFILPYTRALPDLVAGVLVMASTTLASTICWTLFGSLFQRFFDRHRKVMNGIMALLLLYCAVSIFL